MELLDAANTETYGHPEPTKVRVTPVKGKCIAVSGHDLKDLEQLLKQTQGKGINVYTHGEMLPCNAYPELKKYDHFYGHYGTAWQNQGKEFDAFPGAILMTTNCIQQPKETYKDHLFTTGLVGWPGVQHIADKNFAAVIEKALALLTPVQFDTHCDRSVQGSMRTVRQQELYGVLGQVSDVMELAPYSTSARLNDRPVTVKGMKSGECLWPVRDMRAWLEQVTAGGLH